MCPPSHSQGKAELGYTSKSPTIHSFNYPCCVCKSMVNLKEKESGLWFLENLEMFSEYYAKGGGKHFSLFKWPC